MVRFLKTKVEFVLKFPLLFKGFLVFAQVTFRVVHDFIVSGDMIIVLLIQISANKTDTASETEKKKEN